VTTLRSRTVAWVAVLAFVALYHCHAYCHAAASHQAVAGATQHRGHVAGDTSLCLACRAAQELFTVGIVAPAGTLIVLSRAPAVPSPDVPEKPTERRPIVPRGPPTFSPSST
jgi:hypothetical protein